MKDDRIGGDYQEYVRCPVCGTVQPDSAVVFRYPEVLPDGRRRVRERCFDCEQEASRAFDAARRGRQPKGGVDAR